MRSSPGRGFCLDAPGAELSFPRIVRLPIEHKFDEKPAVLPDIHRLDSPPPETIRVLAFIEAASLTGPAKNLIEFARRAMHPRQSFLRANLAIATFHRSHSLASNDFILACDRAGVEVHVIPERFAFDPSVLPAMRRLIVECDPQIVQTHNVKSHFLLRLTAAHRGRRWIAFHHGYTWTDLKVRLYNQLDRWSLQLASRVVTVCRSFASDLENIGIRPERIKIQHNSVDAFLPADNVRVVELRRTLRIPVGTPVLLTVGRLSREKGQADLIEAITLLRKENGQRQLRLVIVGDGPDNHRLREAARTSTVADWVLFAGHQADVTPYYSLADLMVLPSHTEGSPNSLLEAMAAGLPIIATAVGGVPEIVTAGKEALLVEKSNPAALANAIARVLGDANLRKQLSGAARSTASAYSPDVYCESILSMYNSCLSESS
jgi:glycosyltransferase involved in cell wall biosynthesis